MTGQALSSPLKWSPSRSKPPGRKAVASSAYMARSAGPGSQCSAVVLTAASAGPSGCRSPPWAIHSSAARWSSPGTPASSSLATWRLLAEERGRPAGHLLRRDVLDVLAHHPLLAEGIAQPPAALPVELILQ